jgi:hypothetical protein
MVMFWDADGDQPVTAPGGRSDAGGTCSKLSRLLAPILSDKGVDSTYVTRIYKSRELPRSELDVNMPRCGS